MWMEVSCGCCLGLDRQSIVVPAVFFCRITVVMWLLTFCFAAASSFSCGFKCFWDLFMPCGLIVV